MANPFTKNGSNIEFTGEYMEAYVPEYYFDTGIAQMVGDHFSLLGIFNIRVFTDVDGKQPLKLRTVNLPVKIVTYPTGGYEKKKLDLVGAGEDTYYVLKYYNTDVFCQTALPQKAEAFKDFLKILTAGKLPRSFSYDDIITLWDKNFQLNGIKFDIPDVIKELVISEIYRDPSKPEYKFGHLVGTNPSVSRHSYTTANTKDITKYNSSFSAITFENIDEAIVSAVTTTRTERKEQTSPMEQLLKF